MFLGRHITDDREAAADVEIARAIQHRRGNSPIRAGNARIHAHPVGITKRRVNPHRIHRVRILHHHGEHGDGRARHSCAPLPAAIRNDSETGDGAHGVTRLPGIPLLI